MKKPTYLLISILFITSCCTKVHVTNSNLDVSGNGIIRFTADHENQNSIYKFGVIEALDHFHEELQTTMMPAFLFRNSCVDSNLKLTVGDTVNFILVKENNLIHACEIKKYEAQVSSNLTTLSQYSNFDMHNKFYHKKQPNHKKGHFIGKTSFATVNGNIYEYIVERSDVSQTDTVYSEINLPTEENGEFIIYYFEYRTVNNKLYFAEIATSHEGLHK